MFLPEGYLLFDEALAEASQLIFGQQLVVPLTSDERTQLANYAREYIRNPGSDETQNSLRVPPPIMALMAKDAEAKGQRQATLEKLRQQLWAGSVRSYLFATDGRQIPIPRTIWAGEWFDQVVIYGEIRLEIGNRYDPQVETGKVLIEVGTLQKALEAQPLSQHRPESTRPHDGRDDSKPAGTKRGGGQSGRPLDFDWDQIWIERCLRELQLSGGTGP